MEFVKRPSKKNEPCGATKEVYGSMKTAQGKRTSKHGTENTYVGYVSGAPRRPRSPRDAPKPNADKGGEKEDVAESETTKRNASRESNNDQTQIKPEYGHGTFREPPCSSPKVRNKHMQYLLWERKT